LKSKWVVPLLITIYLGINLINQINFLNWDIDIYNDIIILLESIIALRVIIIIFVRFFNLNWNQNFCNWLTLELVWTLAPIIVLLFLGFPSLKILYFREVHRFSSILTLKIIGHQWYWEYNFPEYIVNLIRYPKILRNFIRRGERTTLVIPFNTKIRTLISASDVIHSWAIPSLGFKIDACPGRLNFFIIIVTRPGKHIGQCRELCGNYHSWIPIYVEFSSSRIFFEWISILK